MPGAMLQISVLLEAGSPGLIKTEKIGRRLRLVSEINTTWPLISTVNSSHMTLIWNGMRERPGIVPLDCTMLPAVQILGGAPAPENGRSGIPTPFPLPTTLALVHRWV